MKLVVHTISRCKVYTSVVFSACPSWSNEPLSGPRLYVPLLEELSLHGEGDTADLSTHWRLVLKKTPKAGLERSGHPVLGLWWESGGWHSSS